MNANVKKYLTTLRRIPADIMLSVATREIVPDSGQSCVCGWVMRETLARADNTDAESKDVFFAGDMLAEHYDSGRMEWHAIWEGITDERAPLIEEAFAIRVAECAGGRA